MLEGSRLDRSLDLLDSTDHIDDTLLWDLSGIIHHGFGNSSTLEQTALNRINVLTKDNKTAFSLVVHIESTTSNEDFFANMLLNVVKTCPLFVCGLCRLNKGQITILLIGRNNSGLRTILLFCSLHFSQLLL